MTSSPDALRQRLDRLVAEHGVTGAALAVVGEHGTQVAVAGLRSRDAGEVDADTVFDAASLTKPLVSYALLQLADAGVLDLDEPVAGCTRSLVPDDPVASSITPRQLLSHTAGLQNFARGAGPLKLHFPPGSWFSYSSVGFAWLQLAMEARTGEPLESTMQRLVFDPLGMHSSSLQSHPRFEPFEAVPHEDGKPAARHRSDKAQASWSLKTTAGDYAAFMRAVLQGDRLRPGTWRAWLSPASRVPLGAIVQLDGPPREFEPGLAWGLGWGLETSPGTFFQWGKMPGVRALAMGSLQQQRAIVLLANSNRGLRLMHELVPEVLPGEHPALRWLAEGVTE